MTPGDILGGSYTLESRLGKGGMGEVWRAQHVGTKERVAVKVLLAELAQDATQQKRFVREARAASAVRHPNVVEVREVLETGDGVPFLVMELLTGETLGRRLRRKRLLTVPEVAAIFLPVFDAVEAAHAAGLVHRDLKPENIYLAHDPATETGVRVRVLDFGIAKRVEKLAMPSASSAAETAPAETTAAMLGTPYYMAPEQALGERDIDGRADLWSLGVVLYECLTGQRPTEAPTLGAILKIIVTDGIQPISAVLPGIDAGLATALGELLRSSRDDRAPSLASIRASLAGLADPAFVLDTETDEGIPASLQQPLDAGSLRSRETGASRRSAGAGRTGWIGAGALAAVAIGVVAWQLRGGDAERATVADPGTVAATTVTSASASSSLPASGASGTGAAASAAHADRSAAQPSASASSSTSASASVANAAGVAGVARVRPAAARPSASAAPAIRANAASAGAPSRGPSGLVTDNPFGGPPPGGP